MSHSGVTTVTVNPAEAFGRSSSRKNSVRVTLQHKAMKHWRLMLACLGMIVLGVVAGMVIEEWEFLTALYVIVQIVTTIGYGDVTVDKEWMQLFMAFYVLACLLVVANVLNLMFDVLIESNIQSVREKLRQVEIVALSSIHDHEEAMKRWGATNKAVSSGFLLLLVILFGTVFYRYAEHCSCSYGVTREPSDCDCSSYERCIETGGQEMTWSNAFYMSVITVTTVGFGDFSPHTRLGRAVGILWMVFGVAVTAYFIKALSDVLAREDHDLEFEDVRHLAHRSIFQEMDKDGNGYLSKDEYALYVLVKHDLVSKDILDDIYAKYDSMDAEGTGQLKYETLRSSYEKQKRGSRPTGQESESHGATLLSLAAVEGGPTAPAEKAVPGLPPRQSSARSMVSTVSV